MNVFFCDIVGTFDGDKNRYYKLEEFAKKLESLMEIDELDNLFFSFVSSDEIDTVKNYTAEFASHIKNISADLGVQFASNGTLYRNEFKESECVSKVQQILDFIKKNNVKNIYYADDSLMNQKLVNYMVHESCPNVKVVRFFPGKNDESIDKVGVEKKGISGLNEILSKYIKLKAKKNNKIKKTK